MTTFQIVMIVLFVALVAAAITLYVLGKKAQKKQEEQEAQLAAAAQQVTMLVIDKKRLRLNEAGLPAIVMEQTPKRYRRTKLPIIKAKVGPQIMSLIASEEVFEQVPVKTEVKATVSGIYVTAVRGLRGPLPKVEVKKKTFRSRMAGMYKNAQAKIKDIEAENGKTAAKKSKKK